MGAKYIVQNAHYDYNTPDMIVVSPTVFTSAKYDSEEGLSFKVLTSQYDNFIDELENDLMPAIESWYSIKQGVTIQQLPDIHSAAGNHHILGLKTLTNSDT